MTNEQIHQFINETCGPQELLLNTVKSRILKWFGKTNQKKPGLSKDILQGQVPGKRPRGRPRKQWLDGPKEWTGMSLHNLTRLSEDQMCWREICHNCVKV